MAIYINIIALSVKQSLPVSSSSWYHSRTPQKGSTGNNVDDNDII